MLNAINIAKVVTTNLEPFIPEPIKEFGEFEDTVRIMLDIESEGAGDNANYRIYYIGLKVKGKHILITHKDERTLLLTFVEFWRRVCLKYEGKSILLVGHYIYGYDIGHIMDRCALYNISCPFTQIKNAVTGELYTFNFSQGSYTQRLPLYKVKGAELVDTHILSKNYDVVKSILPSLSLKDVAIHFGGVKRLVLDLNQIRAAWESENPELETYLKYDLDDTERLADELIPPYYEMLRVIPTTFGRLCISTTAKLVEIMLEKYYEKKGVKYNEHPVRDMAITAPGGFVGCNKGFYKKVSKIDVSSLYPSIMLLYDIYPRKDVDRYFLRILSYLKTERLRNKNLKKSPDSVIAKKASSVDQAFKVLINSFFGFLNSEYHSYNDPMAGAKVMLYGRKIMECMLSSMKQSGAKIIEWDTDGVIFIADDPDEVLKNASESLPKGIDLEFEYKNVSWVYMPMKKNYIISDKGELKLVGQFKKRDAMELKIRFIKDLCINYATDIKSHKNIYDEYCKQLDSSTISKSLISKKVKVPKGAQALRYKRDLGANVGDSVTFYYGSDRGREVYTTTGPVYIQRYKSILHETYKDFIEAVENYNIDDQVETVGWFDEI